MLSDPLLDCGEFMTECESSAFASKKYDTAMSKKFETCAKHKRETAV